MGLKSSLSAVSLAAAMAYAAPTLIATAPLDTAWDRSGLSGALEGGTPANRLGGIGSGLAWAGGATFLAIPDRGPIAKDYSGGLLADNTQSFIARFHTLELKLAAAASGKLPFTLTPSLTATTLLYNGSALHYGSNPGLPEAAPAINTADQFYFSGRSDNFAPGSPANPDDARLDSEGIQVSRDGLSVFLCDEYGPHVYQFERATGKRLKAFTLPALFAVDKPNAVGEDEISDNAKGRVANKGMEGLALTPDGKTLMGFMQGPLLQDGGDDGRINRIVALDLESGETRQYAYDNRIAGKSFNGSEVLAAGRDKLLVLERDGKGLGDGSKAVIKQIFLVDLAEAEDVSGLSGEAALLAKAPAKFLFLDIVAGLKAFGIPEGDIPAKLEGMSLGPDVIRDGKDYRTLYLANDNDFLPEEAGPNRFYVFAFTDADLNLGPSALGGSHPPRGGTGTAPRSRAKVYRLDGRRQRAPSPHDPTPVAVYTR